MKAKEEFLVSVSGDTVRVKKKKTGGWKFSKIKHVAEFENYKQLEAYLRNIYPTFKGDEKIKLIKS